MTTPTDLEAQRTSYARWLRGRGLSDRPAGSPVIGLLARLEELERQEARTLEQRRKAPSDLDRRRSDAKLDRIEATQAAIFEQLDSFHPDHVEAMTERFNANRNGGTNG